MSQERLSSWKEVAAYLKCDESTARRWARDSGLPVYRIGNKGGTVHAFTEEIDDWIRGRQNNSAHTNVRDGEVSPSQIPLTREHSSETANNSQDVSSVSYARSYPIPSSSGIVSIRMRSLRSRYIFAGATCLLCIGIALGVVLFSRHPGSVRVSKTAVSGETASGQGSVDIDKINNSATGDQTEEETALHLKAFVKQTQMWEMLTLYPAPWNCDARDIKRYWLVGSKAFLDVGESVSRLNERGWHYGYDSRLLDFQFRYVRISPDGASATVGTREHWWLPLYTQDEKIASKRNPDQGPYEIDYLLTKVNGYWYLKSTTTPYLQWKPKQISCRNWPQ
jgi:hypothetical protein